MFRKCAGERMKDGDTRRVLEVEAGTRGSSQQKGAPGPSANGTIPRSGKWSSPLLRSGNPPLCHTRQSTSGPSVWTMSWECVGTEKSCRRGGPAPIATQSRVT